MSAVLDHVALKVYLFNTCIPVVSALGTDGQIVLIVFVPLIILVILLVVLKSWWNFRKENTSHLCVYDPFFDRRLQSRFPPLGEPPWTHGHTRYFLPKSTLSKLQEPQAKSQHPHLVPAEGPEFLLLTPRAFSVNDRCCGNIGCRAYADSLPLYFKGTTSSKPHVDEKSEHSFQKVRSKVPPSETFSQPPSDFGDSNNNLMMNNTSVVPDSRKIQANPYGVGPPEYDTIPSGAPVCEKQRSLHKKAKKRSLKISSVAPTSQDQNGKRKPPRATALCKVRNLTVFHVSRERTKPPTSSDRNRNTKVSGQYDVENARTFGFQNDCNGFSFHASSSITRIEDYPAELKVETLINA